MEVASLPRVGNKTPSRVFISGGRDITAQPSGRSVPPRLSPWFQDSAGHRVGLHMLLWPALLAGWFLPTPCARAPPAAVKSSIRFQLVSPTPPPTAVALSSTPKHQQQSHWAVPSTYPINLEVYRLAGPVESAPRTPPCKVEVRLIHRKHAIHVSYLVLHDFHFRCLRFNYFIRVLE